MTTTEQFPPYDPSTPPPDPRFQREIDYWKRNGVDPAVLRLRVLNNVLGWNSSAIPASTSLWQERLEAERIIIREEVHGGSPYEDLAPYLSGLPEGPLTAEELASLDDYRSRLLAERAQSLGSSALHREHPQLLADTEELW